MAVAISSGTEALKQLGDVYARVDALLMPFGCDGSAECCKFGVTGREPYPTAVEVAFLQAQLRKSPPPKQRSTRALPIAGKSERRCTLLGSDDRCQAYEARPFGCRTFFCDRIIGPGRFPRREVAELGRKVASISEKFAPRDPGPRPLSKLSLR